MTATVSVCPRRRRCEDQGQRWQLFRVVSRPESVGLDGVYVQSRAERTRWVV